MIERKSLQLAWNRIGSSDSDTYIFSWPVRILERMSRKYQNIRCALYFHFYTVKCERNIRNVVRSRWVTTVLLSFKICRKMSPFVYKHVFHSQRKSRSSSLVKRSNEVNLGSLCEVWISKSFPEMIKAPDPSDSSVLPTSPVVSVPRKSFQSDQPVTQLQQTRKITSVRTRIGCPTNILPWRIVDAFVSQHTHK